jgi:hypothetical protein
LAERKIISSASESMDLRGYLAVLRRHRLLIAVVTPCVLAIMLLWSFQRTPVYVSQTKMLIKPITLSPTLDQGLAGNDLINPENQQQLVESTTVASRVDKLMPSPRTPEELRKSVSSSVLPASSVLGCLALGLVILSLGLLGFGPLSSGPARLTPCMPCHPHDFTRPSAALLGTASARSPELARQGAVVGREAACGIAADNLLIGRTERRNIWRTSRHRLRPSVDEQAPWISLGGCWARTGSRCRFRARGLPGCAGGTDG